MATLVFARPQVPTDAAFLFAIVVYEGAPEHIGMSVAIEVEGNEVTQVNLIRPGADHDATGWLSRDDAEAVAEALNEWAQAKGDPDRFRVYSMPMIQSDRPLV